MLLIAHILSFNTAAQKNNSYFYSNTGEQLGASIKLTAEIGNSKTSFSWRMGISGGAAAFLGRDWLYPSLHADLMLYHGGIGSNWPGIKSSCYADIELSVAYTFTIGLKNRLYTNSNLNPVVRHYPLYYLNTFNIPPLQNPFNYSVSWGGNAIYFFTRRENKFQQVGFANVHADRAQLSYTNDGPPFFPPFGDKFDRMHTGGGFISLHGNNDWPVNLFEIGFNKFTGYSKNTYELSNQAGIVYLYYNDQTQQYYNRSHIYSTIGNTAQNWALTLNRYNYPKWDIQHKIHQRLFYPLHIVPYKDYFSIGGSFLYTQSKIGLQ
ncbi:MAG: hypothetical protein ABIQ88_03135 [Chitinophagaceae bacterium]